MTNLDPDEVERNLRAFRRLDGGEPSPGARVGIDRRSFPPPSSPPSGPAAGILLGLVVSLPLWLIVLIFLGVV